LNEEGEQRDKRPWVRPMLWHICAGKPEGVLEEFSYVPARISGWYHSVARGLRVYIIVIGELPKTRDTLLLRLLGRGRVRREALRGLCRLPFDAWEIQLAHPWLVRLGFDVRIDQQVTSEDREMVMDIHAWYKDFIETHDREVLRATKLQMEQQLLRDLEPKIEQRVLRDLEPKIEQRMLLRLFERRLGRPLAASERDVIAARVKTHGSDHVDDVVLDLSGPELAAWLERDETQRLS